MLYCIVLLGFGALTYIWYKLNDLYVETVVGAIANVIEEKEVANEFLELRVAHEKLKQMIAEHDAEHDANEI